MNLLWPVPGHYFISSGFTDTRLYGMHAGIDIPAPAVPTIAIGGGTVIWKGWAGSAGRSVYLQLDTGWRVHYCHLDTFLVTQGQVVKAGDVIGYVGGSGYERDNYFGSHLHLNLFAPEPPGHYVSWVGMWAVDPEQYLQEDEPMTDEEKKWIAEMNQATNERIQKILDHLAASDPARDAHVTNEANRAITHIVETLKDHAD